MYNNVCSKCGKTFETKNPKRIICSECLYADKGSSQQTSTTTNAPQTVEKEGQFRNNSAPSYNRGQYDRPPRYDDRDNQGQQRNFYNNNRPQGDYKQDKRPFQRTDGYYKKEPGGDGGRYQQQGQGSGGGGRYQQQGQGSGGGGRYQQQGQGSGGGRYQQQGQGSGGGRYQQQGQGSGGGYRQGYGGGNRGRGAGRPQKRREPKKLLISKEQLAEIETLYNAMLPYPNPDAHEIIGEKINLEPSKVFFGINLIRQKMKLSKLIYPKRKLAVSPEQLDIVKKLYDPLLPLPPIGCHKIISKQSGIEEWRVHVAIGIIRRQKSLPRWNEERDDVSDDIKQKISEYDENHQAEELEPQEPPEDEASD